MNTKFKSIFLGISLISLFAVYVLTSHEDKLKSLLIRYNIMKVETQASYISLTYEQLIKGADIIFVGKLTNISPSKWNQDSNEYWEDDSSPRLATPIQLHTLQFDVSRLIIDKIGVESQKTIEVTVLGPSLMDGNTDYNLSIGENVIVFARRTDLIWRDGQTRPITEIVTAPSFAFFTESINDGRFNGQVIHDLGKGNFATENISLPLPDLILQIQSIAQQQ